MGDIFDKEMTSEAVVDGVIFPQMLKYGRLNKGNVFLPPEGIPIQYGRGISNGTGELYLGDIELI
jgi:hypothetical protein